MIGTTIVLNGKSYKVIGKEKRSYILEHEGKHYKATEEKINKILAQNKNKAEISSSQYPNVEAMVKYNQIFDPNAKMPETEPEIMKFFETLEAQMSPENLSCDGEASQSHIRATVKRIRATWSELEQLLGRSYPIEDHCEY